MMVGMETLTLPQGTMAQKAPACPADEHVWTRGTYVPADVAQICSECGQVDFLHHD